jgi:hypothetical protein
MASIKFRNDKCPLMLAKMPIGVLSLPFQSILFAGGNPHELQFNLSTSSKPQPGDFSSFAPYYPCPCPCPCLRKVSEVSDSDDHEHELNNKAFSFSRKGSWQGRAAGSAHWIIQDVGHHEEHAPIVGSPLAKRPEWKDRLSTLINTLVHISTRSLSQNLIDAMKADERAPGRGPRSHRSAFPCGATAWSTSRGKDKGSGG